MSERPIDRSTDSQVNLSAFVHYNNYIAWQFVYRFVEIIYCIYLSDCSLILYGVVLLCCCSCCCIYLWSIWTCSRSFIASSYCLRLAVLSTLVCLFVCRCHSHSNTHTHSLSFSLSLWLVLSASVVFVSFNSSLPLTDDRVCINLLMTKSLLQGSVEVSRIRFQLLLNSD